MGGRDPRPPRRAAPAGCPSITRGASTVAGAFGGGGTPATPIRRLRERVGVGVLAEFAGAGASSSNTATGGSVGPRPFAPSFYDMIYREPPPL